MRAFLSLMALAAALAACDAGPSSCPDTGVVTVEDQTVGTGQPASGTVTVDYVGTLADGGAEFDRGTAVQFALSSVIAGFRQGIGGRAETDAAPAIAPMRAGGRRRIFVPTNFGYGPSEVGTIPACSDLVFDVVLRDP